MFLPIGTNRPIRKPTKVVYWLIGINLVVHMVLMTIEARSPGLARDITASLWLSATPDAAGGVVAVPQGMAPEDYALKPWGFLTYQFLHGGLLHLLGNMLFLWVFGPNIEDRLGRWFFLAFYLAGGVFAGAVFLFFESSGPTVTAVVGASGSISALTGAYLVLFPKTSVKVLLFFLLIGVFYVPAWIFIAFAIFRDLFLQGMNEMGGGGGGVAYMAHIGGYAFGGGVAFLGLWRGIIRREPYDLFTMGRQARRRRTFRELTAAQGKRAWSSELATDAKVSRRERPAPRDAAKEEALARDRARVTEAVRGGELDDAASAYRTLLDTHGDHVVGRDAQLTIANHLNSRGQNADAATAYRLFLERFPRDHEADRVRLLLAILHARSLNDPLAASRTIAKIDEASLADPERDLLEALKSEVC